MKWFNHPRVFWESNWLNHSLRHRWYLAVRDPVYVGLWVGMIAVFVWLALVL